MVQVIVLAAICIVSAPLLRAQSILPVAGGTAEGRPATVVGIDPADIVTDGGGDIWFSDSGNHRIRHVDAATGLISTVAGNGTSDFAGDGGAATQAALQDPGGIARDAAGNLYIADTFNGRIRRVDGTTGVITTFAGRSGPWGWDGDNGPATEAALNKPVGLTLDGRGHLFIGEEIDPRVRRVDLDSGVITTVAGNGSGDFAGDGGPATLASLGGARSLAVDNGGHLLYIADTPNHRIRRVDLTTGTISTVAGNGDRDFVGDDGPATKASLNFPRGIGLDEAGNLYIVDTENIRVRRVALDTSVITTVAGSGAWGFAGDGGFALEATFKIPSNVAVGGGELYIADELDNRIRRVDTVGVITTLAGNGSSVFPGDGGPATQGSFSGPGMVAVDGDGNLFVADTYHQRVRRIDASTRVITTVVGSGEYAHHGDEGDGGPATEAALQSPGAVAVDGEGNLYIGDRGVNRVRRVDASGNITAFAGTGGSDGGDGGPATEALLNGPDGLAVDGAGNVYIADEGNHRVRRVDVATGLITTFAGDGTKGFGGDDGPATLALLDSPGGVAFDSEGNLYIADQGNHRVRRVHAASGTITTVAGDGSSGSGGDGEPATMASLNFPKTVALDGNDLYIADTWNHRVRHVDGVTGIITTVAGDGTHDSRGDGGAATEGSIALTKGIAVDEDGSLYIVEANGNRIRVVHECVEVSSPILTTPSDGSQGLSRFPSLGWHKVSGAFRYDVFLDDVSPPTRLVANDIETTTFAPVNLESLTIYYWRVVAKGDPYCNPYEESVSEVRSFLTTIECGPPGLQPLE